MTDRRFDFALKKPTPKSPLKKRLLWELVRRRSSLRFPSWEGCRLVRRSLGAGGGGSKRLLVPLLLLLFAFTTAAKLQQKPFEILKQRFESGHILHARFKYEYEDTFTNQTSTNSGMLWISSEQYKVVSGSQTIFVDGETSKVYDADRNRVIISKYVEAEDDFAPSRFLNGIDSTYTVAEQKVTDIGYVIELEAQDPFSLYKSITIKLNEQHVPVQIIAIDQADNIITTTFMDASFVKNKRANFYITYPDDAKVIDLRK